MGIWLNDDGLEVRYGVDRVDDNLIGEYRYDGPVRVAEIAFAYTDLPAVAENSVVIKDNFTFPVGAVFEKVEIFTNVDWDSAGDAMTFNLGWVDTDRTSNVDVNAFVDAATQTELNTGGENVAGWVGVAVGGAPLTTAKLLTWEVDAAAATAGEGFIRIYYNVT